MRIQAYTQIQQAYQPKRANKTDKASAVSFSDRLQISSLGKDIQTAKQAVQNSADIREELVAPLRQSVQNGTYDVSDEDFASKLAEKYYGLF